MAFKKASAQFIQNTGILRRMLLDSWHQNAQILELAIFGPCSELRDLIETKKILYKPK
jgi:hypothetical protein